VTGRVTLISFVSHLNPSEAAVPGVTGGC